MMRLRYAITTVSLTLLLAGCGAADSPGERTVVRDSAGIRIVEVAGGDRTDATAWRLADEPSFDIGTLEGDPAYQFHQIRAALRLADGRILVGDGGTNELRFFDASGQFLEAAGGTGGGPGEFQYLQVVKQIAGDSLLVYDSRSRRISLLSPDGAFARSYTPPTVGEQRIYFTDVLSDGRLLGYTNARQGGPDNGYTRDSMLVRLVDPDAEDIRALRILAASERDVSVQENAGRRMVALSPVPYGRDAYAVAAGREVVLGSSDAYEFERYSAAGELERIVRRVDRPPQPVNDEAVERYIDQYIERRIAAAGASFDEARLRDRFRDLPRPPSAAAYDTLAVDDDGNVWVREFALPMDAIGARDWTVFSPEGERIGSVTTPAAFRITHLGSDFVLGIATDEFDVEHVRMYPLLKAEAG